MNCYINQTGSFLPGESVSNFEIPSYMGTLDGEEETREKILRMNGIKHRHYALDENQNATHSLYDLGALAAAKCLSEADTSSISYLSAGSTNAPLVGPGLASILHDELAQRNLLSQNVEINSNSGICTASAQSLVNAVRAIKGGEHSQALALGVEQPSDILKSSVISPPDDRTEYADIRKSKWFMSAFLRSMLSDGAGAMLLGNSPSGKGTSFKVNWTYSRSFANEAPLCMKLENRSLLLSQDVTLLSKFMKPCVRTFMEGGMQAHQEDLSSYTYVLPHLSSFFFKRYMLGVLKEFSGGAVVPHWTNLESRGNTGAASIYVMLDEFKNTVPLKNGDKILLFIPESGQFNFVLLSLTVVK